MAVSAASVAVAGTAVALNAAGPAGLQLVVRNSGANPAALGDSGVTLVGGFELAAGTTITTELDPGDVLFAIASGAAATTLKVLRT